MFIFQNGQNSFSCGPPLFGLFWSVKYVNSGQKLPIKTNHHTFLESGHPDVTKNQYYVLSSKGSQKQVSAPGRIPVCRGVYIHYFKIDSPILCCSLFPEFYLITQLRINKTVNKHTVNYHPSPSQLISRIHPLMFLWTPKAFIRIFLELFPKLVYSTMVAEKFQIYGVRITANTFVSQKIESLHFYSWPQLKVCPRFVSFSHKQMGITHSTHSSVFWRCYLLRRKGAGLWSWKNYQN